MRALAAALALCAAPALAAEPLRVVATIEPLCMLVREIGGDALACTTLVPPGASPHAYEPRPSAMAAVARADLLVRAGNGIDDWAGPLANAGTERWVVLGPECARDDSACAHFWLDPKRAGHAFASALMPLLAARAPEHADAFVAREKAFGAALLAATYDAMATLEPARGSSFLAFHPAWSGFAGFFGLVDLGAIQSHGAEESTPGRLAELIRSARAANVRAVLVEPQLDPHTARIVAEELGARVVTVDPLGDPRDPERASYTALLAWNARQLAAGLAKEPR
ncbi:MAG: zinc ABC transporter substrate-binding protein [Deltaproteobacteria bacterium]|nr:zinc ABC transporter substrate-binding protein [Deltaproteobacteria bacterium]